MFDQFWSIYQDGSDGDFGFDLKVSKGHLKVISGSKMGLNSRNLLYINTIEYWT